MLCSGCKKKSTFLNINTLSQLKINPEACDIDDIKHKRRLGKQIVHYVNNTEDNFHVQLFRLHNSSLFMSLLLCFYHVCSNTHTVTFSIKSRHFFIKCFIKFPTILFKQVLNIHLIYIITSILYTYRVTSVFQKHKIKEKRRT